MFGDSIQTKKQVKNIKESRRRLLKRLLIVLFAAVILVAVTVLVFAVAKPLKIRTIKVVSDDDVFAGDAYSVCEKYIGSDGLKLIPGGLRGIPDILSGRLRTIENEIAFEFPQYKNVRAKISGETLIVTGELRGAYIVFENAGDSVVTDRNGIVVLICRSENLSSEAAGLRGFSEDAPTVTGINISECVVSSKIEYRSDISWNRLVELYFGIYADETLAENVSLIYVPGVRNVYFYCKNNVIVNFGNVSERHATNDKLERLSAIFRTDKIEIRDGTVNLTDSGRDTFRPNGDPDDPGEETPTETPLTEPPTEAPTGTPGEETETPDGTDYPEEAETPEDTEETETQPGESAGPEHSPETDGGDDASGGE